MPENLLRGNEGTLGVVWFRATALEPSALFWIHAPMTLSLRWLPWTSFWTSQCFSCLIFKMEILTTVPICYTYRGCKWNDACDALGRVPPTLKGLSRNRQVKWEGTGFEVNWLISAICWLCDLGWTLTCCVIPIFICKMRIITPTWKSCSESKIR